MNTTNPISHEVLHKELDLVQDVIKRMANNSFMLKGWLISLIALIVALTEKNVLSANGKELYLILCMPILLFWYLDAFFLRQEKYYRKLYEWIVVERPKGNYEQLYALNPQTRFVVESISDIMISVTLRWFYGIPLVFCIGMLIYKSLH